MSPKSKKSTSSSQIQAHQPCIHCHEPSVLSLRCSMASKIRVTKGVQKSSTVREALENLLAKCYGFEGVPIESGHFLCKRCFHKLSTLWSSYEDFTKISSPESYIQSLVIKVKEEVAGEKTLKRKKKTTKEMLKKMPKASKLVSPKQIYLIRYSRTPQRPLKKELHAQFKTGKGATTIRNFIVEKVRAEVVNLTKNCKAYHVKSSYDDEADLLQTNPAAIKDIDVFDPKTFELFWEEVCQGLKQHAPLIYHILYGIAVKKKFNRLKRRYIKIAGDKPQPDHDAYASNAEKPQLDPDPEASNADKPQLDPDADASNADKPPSDANANEPNADKSQPDPEENASNADKTQTDPDDPDAIAPNAKKPQSATYYTEISDINTRKLLPAVGTAISILLNSRNERCSNFQKYIGQLLYRVTADGEKQKTFEFFNKLNMSVSWWSTLRGIKRAAPAPVPAAAEAEENCNAQVKVDLDVDDNVKPAKVQRKLPIKVKVKKPVKKKV